MNIQGVPATDTSAFPLTSTASSSNNTSSNSAANLSNENVSESAFLQLIATELQAQDPTNPLDPTQFLGQLVQFNMLDQLTGIYNLLADGANTAAGANSQTPSVSSLTSASAASSLTQSIAGL
jgi:flagellar basal-body rod modification protein FlgD